MSIKQIGYVIQALCKLEDSYKEKIYEDGISLKLILINPVIAEDFTPLQK